MKPQPAFHWLDGIIRSPWEKFQVYERSHGFGMDLKKHLFFCSPCSYTVICALITRKYGMPFCSPDLNVPVTVISLSNSG